MDIQALALLLDQQARNEIDARLEFIAGDLHAATTTRNVVFAPDPLKDISNPFENLMTVPTDPPSNRVHMIGGHFYATGKLYAFPGVESEEIDLSKYEDTYILTGVYIDRRDDSMDFYCQTYHGEYPFMDPAVIPSALIKVPKGSETILSAHIMDLRPFLHYNVSTPEDRVVIRIGCLNAKESVSFSLLRNHRLPPIMSFYTQVPPPGTSMIVHRFSSMDDVVVLSKELPEYNSDYEGITLRKRIATDPIDISTGPNVIIVDALNGNDTYPGTLDFPVRTVEAAVDKLNGMLGYDTIFILEGVYAPTRTLVINKDVKIIGRDPLKCIFNLLEQRQFVTANAEVRFQTLQFQYGGLDTSSFTAMVEAFEPIWHYNCIFRQQVQQRVKPWVLYHKDIYISNCIIYNPQLATTSPSDFYVPATGWSPILYLDRIENNIVLGTWTQIFISGTTTHNLVEQNGDPISLEDRTSFYPAAGAAGVDGGITTLVGADKDGSLTDVGLYGGRWASRARVGEYPIDEFPVFKYAYQTMFSPVIQRFVGVSPIVGYAPSGCKVYGAVSFDGGHNWLIWDESLGAWKKIPDLSKLYLTDSTSDKLAKALVDMGPIPTKGEIVFAWGLKTEISTATPCIKGVNIIVKADGESLIPIPTDDLSVMVAEDTVMVTNISMEQKHNLVIVAY